MLSWLKGKNKLEKEMSTNVDGDGSNNKENTSNIVVDNADANFDNMSVNTNDTVSAAALTMRSLHTPRSNVDLRSMQSAQSLQMNEDSDRDSFHFDRDHEQIIDNNEQHDDDVEQEYNEQLNKKKGKVYEEGFGSDNKNGDDVAHMEGKNDDGDDNKNVKSESEKKTESNNQQHQYELQENEFARLQQHEEENEYEPEIAQGTYEMHYPSYYKYEEELQEEEQQQHELSMEYPSDSSDAEYDEMLLNLEFNALIDVEETNRLLIRCEEYDECNDLKQKHNAFINSEMNKVNNQTNVKVDVLSINNKNNTDTTNVQESKYMPSSIESDAIHKQETQYVPLRKRSINRKKSNNNNTIKSTKAGNNDVMMDVNTCEPTCEDNNNSTSSSSDNDNKDDYHLHHYSDDADLDDSKLNIMKGSEKFYSNDEYSESDNESSTKDEEQTLQTESLANEKRKITTLEQTNKEEREVEGDNEATKELQEEEKQLLEHKTQIEESYHMNKKYVEEEDDDDNSGSDDQTVDSVMELEHIRQFFWPINIAALPYNDRPRFLLNVNAVCEEKCGCHESEKSYHESYSNNNNKGSKSKENDSYSYTQLEGESYDTYNELNKVEETAPSSTSSVYQWIINKAESFLDYWQSGNDLNIIGGYSHSTSILPALRIQEEDQENYSKELEMEEYYNERNVTLGMMNKKQYMLQNKQMIKNRSSRSSTYHTTPSQSYHSQHNKHANYDNKPHYKSEAVNKTRIQENKSSNSNKNLETSANQALCAHMTQYPSYGTSDVANELHYNNNMDKKKRKNSQSFLYDTNYSHKSTWSIHDSHATDKVLLHSPITVQNLQLLWIATTTRQYLFSFLSFVYVSLLFAQGLLWIMLDTLPLSTTSSSSSSLEFMHPTSNNYFYNNKENTENTEGVIYNLPSVIVDINKGNKSNHVASNFIIFLFKYCQGNRVTLMEAVSFGVIGFTILLQFLTCGISAVHFTRMPHLLLCVGACMAIASALLIKQSADREQGTFLITGAVLHGCGTGFGLIGCLICAITEMGLVAGMSVQLQIMLLAWFVSSAVVYTFAPIMYHFNNYYSYNNINIMNDVNSITEKENVLRFPLYLACTSLLFAVALICLVRRQVIERGANAYKHHFRSSKLINAVKGVSVRFVFRGMACVLVTSMIALMASSCEVLLSWPLDLIASHTVTTPTQSSFPTITVFSSFQVEEHQPIVFAKDNNGHLLYSSASSTVSSPSPHYSTLDVQLKHSASSCRLISLLFLSALLTWPFCLIPGKCFALTGQFVKVTIMVLLTATCWTLFTSHVWPVTHIQNTEPFLLMPSPSVSNNLPLNNNASNTASSELLSITPSPQAHIWLVASVICTGLCCTLLISGILQSLMRVGLTYTTSSSSNNNKLNHKKNWYSTLQGNASSSVRSSRHSQRIQSYKNSNKSITQSRVSTNANSYASQIEPTDNYTTQLQTTKVIEIDKNEKNLLIASSSVKNNHPYEHLKEEQEYCGNNDLEVEQVELCNDSYVLDGKAIEVNSIESIRSQMLRDLRDGPASTIALSVTLVIVLLFTCGVNNVVAALILRHAAHTQIHTQSEWLQVPQQGSKSTSKTKHVNYLHSTFFSANPTVQGYLQLLLMIDVISWLAVGCVLGEMIYIYRIKLRKMYAHIVSFLSVVIDYLFCCCFAITQREQVNEYDV